MLLLELLLKMPLFNFGEDFNWTEISQIRPFLMSSDLLGDLTTSYWS